MRKQKRVSYVCSSNPCRMMLVMAWVLTRMNSPMSTSTSEVSKGCSRTIPPNAVLYRDFIFVCEHPRHMIAPSEKWSDDKHSLHDEQTTPDGRLQLTSQLISCSITASPFPRSNKVENSTNKNFTTSVSMKKSLFE